jgi:hypothetical protein
METFTKVKGFENNPHYYRQRLKTLKSLDLSSIDKPVAEIIDGFLKLPYCFTLQSCYGHFLYEGQKNPHNIEPLPKSNNIKTIEYRIAYTALCIQNSELGRILFKELAIVPEIDSEYVQFGCAEWFWERYLNSFVLQVEPERYFTKDEAFIEYEEALYIENIRNRFFKKLKDIITWISF